jgi:hypothetical protein
LLALSPPLSILIAQWQISGLSWKTKKESGYESFSVDRKCLVIAGKAVAVVQRLMQIDFGNLDIRQV